MNDVVVRFTIHEGCSGEVYPIHEGCSGEVYHP